MDIEKWTLRAGAAALACVILLQLGKGRAFEAVGKILSGPKALSVILFLETGRVLPPVVPQQTNPPTQTEQQPEPVSPSAPEKKPEPVTFMPDDAQLVEVNSVCGYDTDLPLLLQNPLNWDLRQEKPTVLILHTHGTESYKKTEDYQETSAYRTQNTEYNVVSVGEHIKKILETGGIAVIHDKTLYDHPTYSSSYTRARSAIKKHLQENPSIALVLDIHRDSVENGKGEQVEITAEADGKKVAKLMMVVGTDANGLNHPKWKENMALAVKLHALLEKKHTGICRPISFRPQRFNQDLSTGGMLIEVGTAGNTRQQALDAAQILAETILQLADGTAG